MSQGVPLAIESSEISSNLNAFILLAFLMGIYTVIYCGTVYIYHTRSAAKRRLILASLTVQYLVIIAQFAVQWYVTKRQFVDEGATRESVFASLFGGLQWTYIVSNALAAVGFVLADGLLIWRCYFVWDHSLYIISVPLILVFAEAALFLVESISHGIFTPETISLAKAAAFDDVLSAAFFTSFTATLVTTVLIAYRIHSVTNQEGVSRRRFQHVFDIVVQSGAVYSLSLLASAISNVVTGADKTSAFDTHIAALDSYIQYLNTFVSGAVTTVMVARVALLSPDTTFPSTSIHLSGLQFHARSRSTQQTDTPQEMNASLSVAADRLSACERQITDGKVQ